MPIAIAAARVNAKNCLLQQEGSFTALDLQQILKKSLLVRGWTYTYLYMIPASFGIQGPPKLTPWEL